MGEGKRAREGRNVKGKARIGKGNTHTHPFNGPLSGTIQVSRYKKGKTNPDFTGFRE